MNTEELIRAAEALRSGREVRLSPDLAGVIADWLTMQAEYGNDFCVSYAVDAARLINSGAVA